MSIGSTCRSGREDTENYLMNTERSIEKYRLRSSVEWWIDEPGAGGRDDERY
jgi:hypothetical protein